MRMHHPPRRGSILKEEPLPERRACDAMAISRLVVRFALCLLALASAGALIWQGYTLASNPAVQWLAAKPVDQVRQVLTKALATAATPLAVDEALAQALAETPADWPVIDGLLEYQQERGIALAPAREAEIAERRREEVGWIAQGKACWRCTLDPDNCQPSLALVCNVAVELTPVGDFRSLGRAAGAYWQDQAVDYLDVGLATVGLVATVGSVASFGAAYGAKVGAGVLKVARKAGAVSAPLSRHFRRMTNGMVDFGRLPKNGMRSPKSLLNVVDTVRLRAFGASMSDLGAISARQGPAQALRVLRQADSPGQLAALRRGSDAMDSRFPATLRVLGKSRVIGAASRWSRTAWSIVGSVAALLGALLGLFGNALGSVGLRGLRWWVRRS